MRDQIDELTVPELRRLLEVALPLAEREAQKLVAWSSWRREMRVIEHDSAITDIANGLNMPVLALSILLNCGSSTNKLFEGLSA